MTKMRAYAISVAGLGALASIASGETRVLFAEQDLAETSEFALNFAGAPASPSEITFTQFDVEVDVVNGTARFTDYYQQVEPLLLPLPDGSFVSTGDMVIEIVPGSSAGTYNAVTQTFETTDLYAIHFEGDLSVFGFTSPVVLPGDSLGQVFDGGSGLEIGDIVLAWEGAGELPNPADPQNPIPFTYTCDTSTDFEDDLSCDVPCAGDVNQDCNSDTTDLLTVLGNFGEAEFYTTPRRGDLDGDLDVDFSDLLFVLGAFGRCN